MDSGNVSAIISAVAGISGVLLGNSFLTIKEVVVGWRRRKKDAHYLAILVVSHIDRFAAGCSYVAFDDGTEYGQPAGGDGEYRATTTPPEFQPLDIKVEWKTLPNELLYDIMMLPHKKERIQTRLAGISEYADDYPDHAEWFWARRRDYAELALHAFDVSTRLRKYVGMPSDKAVPGEWSVSEGMREVITKIDGEREAYEKRIANSMQVPRPASTT